MLCAALSPLLAGSFALPPANPEQHLGFLFLCKETVPPTSSDSRC
jgi:hypothetical protein